MKHKISPIIGYCALIGIALGITVFLYWIYSPPKEAVSVSPNPITVVDSKILKNNPVCTLVKSDRCIVIKFTRCKNTGAVGRVTTTLVGTSVQIPLPTSSDSGERKCNADLQYPVPVPSIAAPGTYHFHFRATYQVNPLRSIVQEYDTEAFEVL